MIISFDDFLMFSLMEISVYTEEKEANNIVKEVRF